MWTRFGPANLWSGVELKTRVARLTLITALAVLPCVAHAQTSEASSLDLYSKAVVQPVMADRIASLERFLAANPNSSLRHDTLSLLVWSYVQSNNPTKAAEFARLIIAGTPNDPLALAALADHSAPKEEKESPKKQVESAKHALEQYRNLRKPEAMREIEFATMRQYVWRTLTGAAGLAYLEQKNYKTARDYLSQVAAASPNDPRYVYGLALATLNADDDHKAEGYWYLAKAVTLSGNTPEGRRVADYARELYKEDGGSSADWDRFLAAAAAPRTSPDPVVVAKANTPPAQPPPKEEPAPTKPADVTAEKPDEPAKDKDEEVKEEPRVTADASRTPRPRDVPEPKIEEPPRPPRKPRPPADDPLSLGILVQMSNFTPEYRKTIVFALSDMVRHIRSNDEVFILAFSDKLDFVQDLTDNSDLLEEAIDSIKPQSGAALFDAVAFAAGHLKRIAKNQNRTLLVISDGSNAETETSAFDLRPLLKDVRIDCIGLNVGSSFERSVLQQLSTNSGGQVTFANDQTQLRNMTRELAMKMGIDFQQ